MTRAWTVAVAVAVGMAAGAPAAAEAPQIRGALKRAQQLRDVQMTDAEEQELGAAVSARIRQRYGVVQSEPVHRYVTLAGTVLAQASSRPDLPWTFIVLDTDAVNAFAAPGGYVHITRGALAIIRDEAELAGVLAHELVHITGKHTVGAIQKGKLVQMGADETVAGNSGLFDRLVDAATDVVLQGFGRGEEIESDRDGVALANKAGYAPQGLGVFLTRLRERHKDATEKRGLFASHPEMQERLDRIDKQIASAKMASTATVAARYSKTITYKPVNVTSIAVVEGGASGLAGGDEAPAEDTRAGKAPPAPKKRGFGLSNLPRPGGAERQSAQATGSGGARGVDPERDAIGGANPTPVPVRVTPAQIAEFKKSGGLITPGLPAPASAPGVAVAFFVSGGEAAAEDLLVGVAGAVASVPAAIGLPVGAVPPRVVALAAASVGASARVALVVPARVGHIDVPAL
jgi:beta-barrel assembly-enhancing protease